MNLLKHVLKTLVKSQQVNLILAGFIHLKPQCGGGALQSKRWLPSATRVAAASHGTKRAAASKVRNLSDRFLDTKATDDKLFNNPIKVWIL
jgi:hypothetical protein